MNTVGCETKNVKGVGRTNARTDGHVNHLIRSSGDDLKCHLVYILLRF